ncbi:Hypothetical protein NTJ_09920 [Nesidiocoris tenuis]|uniref:Uncharacterized protein n=1 Tax=Nesidiocoris tenuis TaxID=355587 RepID=A0ABN7AY45_9HEMI|nr:Hypothetical protein NTJ_09920 [Nesidiocoris tenuis]
MLEKSTSSLVGNLPVQVSSSSCSAAAGLGRSGGKKRVSPSSRPPPPYIPLAVTWGMRPLPHSFINARLQLKTDTAYGR